MTNFVELKQPIVLTLNGEVAECTTVELKKPTMATFAVYDQFKSRFNDLLRAMAELSANQEVSEADRLKAEEATEQGMKPEDFMAMMDLLGSKVDREGYFKAFDKLCDAGLLLIEDQKLNLVLRNKLDIEDYYRLVGAYTVDFFMMNK